MKEWNDSQTTPPVDEKFSTISVDIDILTEEGKIFEGGFYTTNKGIYFTEEGSRIKNVKGWRVSNGTHL